MVRKVVTLTLIDELLKRIEALEATVASQGKKIEKLEAEKEVKDHAIDAMKKCEAIC